MNLAGFEKAGNNNKQQHSCGCALLNQRLNKVFQHCGGPLSAITFSSSFQPPQNRGCIWVVVATLSRSTSQTFRNWQSRHSSFFRRLAPAGAAACFAWKQGVGALWRCGCRCHPSGLFAMFQALVSRARSNSIHASLPRTKPSFSTSNFCSQGCGFRLANARCICIRRIRRPALRASACSKVHILETGTTETSVFNVQLLPTLVS